MTDNDFKQIEDELGIYLNNDYKTVARGTMLTDTILYNKMFYTTPTRIIKVNKKFREKGLYGFLLARNHFIFACLRDQYFFIDTDSNDTKVYTAFRSLGYDPEAIGNRHVCSSIKEMVYNYTKRDYDIRNL